MDNDRVVSLPEPLLEQPEGAPPLSELSAESLALVVDGPSLVSYLGTKVWTAVARMTPPPFPSRPVNMIGEDDWEREFSS